MQSRAAIGLFDSTTEFKSGTAKVNVVRGVLGDLFRKEDDAHGAFRPMQTRTVRVAPVDSIVGCKGAGG